ncbi:sensor domain-containing protein [Neobacillus jeddahensis]|uniref:sensor domain-containing protein n=1 Tax=Neobacillus jeddahensis TaxID=1461580 RepID=UPI000693EB4C|nr:bifunctional diguanylate cyclase/phosphodiesterase [Neobacillus jeddahensis]
MGFLNGTFNILLVIFSIGFLAIIILFAFYLKGKFTTRSHQLKINEQHFQSLYQYNPDIVVTYDTKGNFLNANHIVESYGYRLGELLHRPFAFLVVPDQLENAMEHFLMAAGGTATNFKTAFFNKMGERIEVKVTLIPIIVEEQIVGVFGIHKDITNLIQTREALVEAEMKYRSLVEDSLLGIYVIQDERFVYVNPQLLQVSGYRQEELIGLEISQFIFPEDLPVVTSNIQNRVMNELNGIRYQFRAIKKDQSILYLEVYASNTTYHGNPAIIGSVIDMTEQKIAEEKIQHLAFHDVLTGLPNRNYFTNYFDLAIARDHVTKAAILVMDLDRFKIINDTLGHDLGDQLLIEVSKRLKCSIQLNGCLARHAGDEFLLFLPEFDHEGTVETVKQLLARLNEPFLINEYEVYITPSIGISRFPHDDEEIGTLIKKADLAMQQAKQLGKNNFQFYMSKSIEMTKETFELEKDLRKAIENEEFVVYYQPKVNIHTGDIIGLEALIRWEHPDKGLISPAQFIPLAEETGMIVPIGEWVLREACTKMKAVHETGFPAAVISVNLSVRQFFQSNLIQLVSQILDESGLAPKYLELEITESFMIDTHQAHTIVSNLKKLGVRISLDDFGTGYSSLHYLKKFPIDILKIDQSFIRDCISDENDGTIVKTIIAMAHQLKMEVIAEGVETNEQLIFLQQNDCNNAQGYLFSKPIPIEEIVKKYVKIEKCI